LHYFFGFAEWAADVILLDTEGRGRSGARALALCCVSWTVDSHILWFRLWGVKCVQGGHAKEKKFGLSILP
jgi:hypothetical protein